MIATFHDKETRLVYLGTCPARFEHIRRQAERKLLLLDQADSLDVLRSIPGNRLEKLHGNRSGQWSIRINRQWRVCFRFVEGMAFGVEITDYH